MGQKLEALFSANTWSRKFYDCLPEDPDSIRYAWHEEEADYARLFLTSGILHESTVAVQRSMYLGREKSGAWRLYVCEATQPDYDVKEIAAQISSLMSMDKIVDALGKQPDTPASESAAPRA